ncbi:3834_t:CDS:2, partial [Gigaspora margarita]
MAKTRGGKTTNSKRVKKKAIEETSDEENSEQQVISNKHKSNEPARAPFVPINFNNNVPIPANNVARSIQRSQDSYNYNDYSSNYTNHTRSSYNIDPELIHNSPSNIPIQSNFINPNLTYNTHSSSKNINRLQVSYNDINNSEDRSMISRNSVISEQQHRSLSRATTMSLDEVSDLYSPTYQDKDSSWQQNSYNYHKENDLKSNLQPQHTPVNSYNMANTATQRLDNNSKELNFPDEQSLVNWLCTWPDLIMQVQNLTASLPNKAEANLLEPTDKEVIINLVMEQCKLLFLRIRNPSRKIREKLIKKIVPSMDPVSKEFKALYRKTREYFDNFRCTFNKDMAALAKDLLVKN